VWHGLDKSDKGNIFLFPKDMVAILEWISSVPVGPEYLNSEVTRGHIYENTSGYHTFHPGPLAPPGSRRGFSGSNFLQLLLIDYSSKVRRHGHGEWLHQKSNNVRCLLKSWRSIFRVMAMKTPPTLLRLQCPILTTPRTI
jgi:hypothetical protein